MLSTGIGLYISSCMNTCRSADTFRKDRRGINLDTATGDTDHSQSKLLVGSQKQFPRW